jgi:hypothetical protein
VKAPVEDQAGVKLFFSKKTNRATKLGLGFLVLGISLMTPKVVAIAEDLWSGGDYLAFLRYSASSQRLVFEIADLAFMFLTYLFLILGSLTLVFGKRKPGYSLSLVGFIASVWHLFFTVLISLQDLMPEGRPILELFSFMISEWWGPLTRTSAASTLFVLPLALFLLTLGRAGARQASA